MQLYYRAQVRPARAIRYLLRYPLIKEQGTRNRNGRYIRVSAAAETRSSRLEKSIKRITRMPRIFGASQQ